MGATWRRFANRVHNPAAQYARRAGFLRPGIRQASPSLSEPCAMHTREPAKYNRHELRSCSYWSRACFCRARIAGSTGREAPLQRVRDFLAVLDCPARSSTPRDAADQLGLPQQPMPTMKTLRASDAGRPPARTSAEEKCFEVGPCLQWRLWLRALKTLLQHCPTRPGAHLPCPPKSPQTCVPSARDRTRPTYQARGASTTKFCSRR